MDAREALKLFATWPNPPPSEDMGPALADLEASGFVRRYEREGGGVAYVLTRAGAWMLFRRLEGEHLAEKCVCGHARSSHDARGCLACGCAAFMHGVSVQIAPNGR